ncbi:FecR family protein [Sphingomonas hylomeconis]|uniref:FecR family protein n=1 Tax=Sphingomonas hylomeconis TaxID=1395958 RepID=A0ABV7SUW6_9SPHN|nr:FecR domain-containing protein [Sphingomonas hylomeconis]
MTVRQQIEQEALQWLARINDAPFDDWNAFSDWLAVNQAHAETYWALAEHDAAITAMLRDQPPAHIAPLVMTTRPPRWQAWRRAALAVAAIGLATIGVREFGATPPAVPSVLQTPPGKVRTVRLADGSTIAMNGGTRLVLASADGRTLRLERGQATFTVTHDAAHPFTVAVGTAIVRDIGTVFDIVQRGSGAQIAVAEGRVAYHGSNGAIELAAGQLLTERGGVVTIARQPVTQMGGWRTGRLSYQQAPLREVADDLGRALGVPMILDPAISARRFSGSIRVRGDAEAMRATLAPLLGVRIEPAGDGWRLRAATAAP